MAMGRHCLRSTQCTLSSMRRQRNKRTCQRVWWRSVVSEWRAVAKHIYIKMWAKLATDTVGKFAYYLLWVCGASDVAVVIAFVENRWKIVNRQGLLLMFFCDKCIEVWQASIDDKCVLINVCSRQNSLLFVNAYECAHRAHWNIKRVSMPKWYEWSVY